MKIYEAWDNLGRADADVADECPDLGRRPRQAEPWPGGVLRRLPDRPEMAWLWSLAGLGAWTAAVVWAWIGDPQRFRSARQVTRYAGLDPSVHQSGEADWRGHTSHQGPAMAACACGSRLVRPA